MDINSLNKTTIDNFYYLGMKYYIDVGDGVLQEKDKIPLEFKNKMSAIEISYLVANQSLLRISNLIESHTEYTLDETVVEPNGKGGVSTYTKKGTAKQIASLQKDFKVIYQNFTKAEEDYLKLKEKEVQTKAGQRQTKGQNTEW